jgi:hypothetical protein
MADARQVGSVEGRSSKSLDKAGWGLLLIWTGTALLLHFGWGAGLTGAGAIVLAMHGVRRYAGLPGDPFAIVAGALLVICGVWNLFQVSVDVVPVLCIGAGVVLLASSWAARRHAAARAT